jgi:hypothetical protein
VATLSDAAAAGATEVAIEPLTPSAAVLSGTALPQQVTIEIAKTPAGVAVRRRDDGVALTSTDTTWSGGYLFLRNHRDGVAAVSCASLTIE